MLNDYKGQYETLDLNKLHITLLLNLTLEIRMHQICQRWFLFQVQMFNFNKHINSGNSGSTVK